MKFYAPLTKVEEQDDGSLRIEGIASSEVVDSAGEIVLASAMKAAVPGFMAYGTGALREMHGLSAAGTVDEVEVRDDGNTYVKATVIDDHACRKLLKKVYKGLSIGGRVLSRDPENRKVITGIAWSELSLVDRPCCPSATIELVRADWTQGLTEEQIESAEPDAPEADIEDEKNAAAQVESTEESDEDIADYIADFAKRDFDAAQRKKDAKNGTALKDGSFPIQDKEDLKNAIRLAGRAKNPAAARAHIKRRAKALGAEDMIPDTWKDSAKKADTLEIDMAAKKKAADTIENSEDAIGKSGTAAPINPKKLVDVLNDAQASRDTALNTPVAGKHVDPALPGGSTATSQEVKNPEEAGQASPEAIAATETPVVQGASGKADEGESISQEDAEGDVTEKSEEAEEADPVANARAAADKALKAATAVMQSLAKRDGEVPEPLREGLELRKGLPSAGRLGCLLTELAYCLADAQFEKALEGDESEVPEKLHAAVETLAAAYKAMSDEELQELLDSASNTMTVEIALAAASGDLAKALDGVVDADALAKAVGSTEHSALTKAEGRISSLEGERETLLKTVVDLTGGLTNAIDTLSKRVDEMASEATPPKTIAKTDLPPTIAPVTKAEDTVGAEEAAALAKGTLSVEEARKALEAMSEEDRAMLLMKASLAPTNAKFFKR